VIGFLGRLSELVSSAWGFCVVKLPEFRLGYSAIWWFLGFRHCCCRLPWSQSVEVFLCQRISGFGLRCGFSWFLTIWKWRVYLSIFIDSVSEPGDWRFSLSRLELRSLESMLQCAVLQNCCLGRNALLISSKVCAFAFIQVCAHSWIPGITVEIVAKTAARLMSGIRFSSSICQEKVLNGMGSHLAPSLNSKRLMRDCNNSSSSACTRKLRTDVCSSSVWSRWKYGEVCR